MDFEATNMSATSSKTRKSPPDDIRRGLATFYAGLGCVVTGSPVSRVSLHHLDGDNSYSEFPNLLPLALDLHNGLKVGLAPEDLRQELREVFLKEKAEEHFKAGQVPRAYGCLRLAYALSAHFFRKSDRDLNTEFQTAAHCLYFLRRCIGQAPLELVYYNLHCLLGRELQRTLNNTKIIPPFGAFCLLIELASWMNECGWFKQGLDLLRMARKRLRRFQSLLAPKDISRFQRQLANALVQMGQYSAELEAALQKSLDYDDSENSEFGVFNTRLNLHLGKSEAKDALAVLKERFDYFERETDYFFSPLNRMQPTIMTSLGYIALSLICESQLIRSRKHGKRLENRLQALKVQEQRYGRSTVINRVPALIPAAISAARNLPPMRTFLDGRLFPILPKAVADVIQKVAQQL